MEIKFEIKEKAEQQRKLIKLKADFQENNTINKTIQIDLQKLR